MSAKAPTQRAARRDWGRVAARLLCAVFALLGLLPLLLALLTRSEPVRRFVAAETARVLAEQLGVEASYRVQVRLWPFELAIDNLVVRGSDGRGPALSTERVSVQPKVLSLLAGRLDVGAIRIQGARARLVFRNGRLENVSYRLPKSKGKGAKLGHAPFTSISVRDARVELDVDGLLVQSTRIDADVSARDKGIFVTSLDAGPAVIRRTRKVVPKTRPGEPALPPKMAHDEDRLCRLHLRARIEPGSALVQELRLSGVGDLDDAPNTLGNCANDKDKHPTRIALSADRLRIAYGDRLVPAISGHVAARAPLPLINRFVRMPKLTGSAGFSGQLAFDGKSKLPELRGRLLGENIAIGAFKLAKHLNVELALAHDTVNLAHYEMGFADGVVIVKNSVIHPFAKDVPFTAERVDGSNVAFESIMRDMNVTPDTIIKWGLKKTKVTKIGGTLHPLHIDGEFTAETRDFEVFDRAYHDPARKHVIGVRSANVRGRVKVSADALEFHDARTDFGKSHMQVNLVSVGFSNELALRIGKGSKLELSDITPLLNIPMSGSADLAVEMSGKGTDPTLTGDLAVQNLEFGGFPIGNLTSGKVKFKPLFVEFTDVHGHKGRSEFFVPSARLDFDTSSAVLADAIVKSDKLGLRDFFAMWLFDSDPRFANIDGEGAVNAKVHYDLGGREDRCKSGALRVTGDMAMRKLSLFDERYDAAKAEFDFAWSDMTASYLGIDLNVPSLSLQKGSGSMLGSLTVERGAKVRGHFVGSSVPLAKFDALGSLALAVDGSASAITEISGTFDELAVDSHVRVSPIRVGSATLPASEFDVKLVPVARPLSSAGKTRCGLPIPGKFERGEYEADRSQGVFHIEGQMFAGQIRMNDLQITRQRSMHLSGSVNFNALNLGAVSELSPLVALSSTKPHGTLTGGIKISDYALDKPFQGEAELKLTDFEIERSGMRASLLPGAQPIVLGNRQLDIPALSLSIRSPRGASGVFDVRGRVDRLDRTPQIDATLRLRPIDLAAFADLIPRAERAHGQLSGSVQVSGSPASLAYSGGFALRDGELRLRGFGSPVSDIQVALALRNDELRITRGSAKVGNGSVTISGGAQLRGSELGPVRAVLKAREISTPPAQGLRSTLDADLVATWQPSSGSLERSLPRVTGDITLRSLEYTRPIGMTADISALTQRGKRTEFESYDPADDALAFDVTVRANRTLRIANNLMEMELEMQPQGLLLAGTNQRFGLRGAMRIKPGGRIRLRQSEFEVRQGNVRFDDLTRIAPQVDVTASTEYRRYSDTQSPTDPNRGRSAEGQKSGITTSAGGRWLITMHAHGDADKLRIDLTSEPALAQDDIFLLLTVGLTRAELDQAQSASVGESVALEALGALTGADRAVKEAVPVIDEFRFGSAYSSRTGRTEPTVTIGKRLAQRIRANVTSGLSESREIRSNLEWRLSPRVSVEGSYDNVNDISSSSLGNLGGDVRWRLEFE